MKKTKQELSEEYEEKQERRLERYKELSQKAEQRGKDAYEHLQKLMSVIPMGQPILVGHYSEKGHRAHLSKIDNQMRKSITESEKAEYYKDKVKSIEENNAISSDNPEAIDLLKDKLTKLENQRTKIKEHNKEMRKQKKEGYPSYVLSNLGQNINTVKKRISHLEKLDAIEEEEEVINGVKLKLNKDDNRVQLFFNGKPPLEERKKLKSNGFRWSPYNGCWQRKLSETSIFLGREILNELCEVSDG